jgi:hypothetical protein
VEKNKSKQELERGRVNHPNKTAEKDARVKSEKLRYKNADSIYDI